jgi:hypothetical protein
MMGSRTIALIFAILLLLTGGGFLVFGIGGSWLLLIIAAYILSLAGLLFWVAFDTSGLPQTPENSEVS